MNHACGILKRLSDDNQVLFFTGGLINYRPGQTRTGRYTGTSYSSKLFNLQTGSYSSLAGITNSGQRAKFVNISPYEGFIFGEYYYNDGYYTWYIWNAKTQNFDLSKIKRDTIRREVATASIPISSPMVKNCF